MDPITGLAALAGVTLASVASLRLKKMMSEGFTALPNMNVEESQSRYNMFSQLLNPITNSIIPVGSPDSTVKQQKELVNSALGSSAVEYSPDSSQTLILKNFKNQFQVRSDTNKSLYGAMKFCREAGKQSNPFTIYNSDGSVKVQGAVSPDGNWKFDEVCGVCLTGGVDEEGKRFRTQQGMVIDQSAKQKALSDQESNAWPYPRMGPAIGTCDGAPNTPSFAVTAKDLEKFKARQACLNSKTVGGTDNCAICYESNDVYAAVPSTTQTNVVSLALQGTGNVQLSVRGSAVSQKTLSETSPVTVELTGAKEGDSFGLTVTGTTGQTVNIYGYLFAKTPREGLFTMPLNLLMTIDDETGSAPSKSGGFYTFSNVGLDTAKMRPGTGKSQMRLRGTLPFTFVQPSEFSAMDCLDAPYQTKLSSATAFSTDQPCFAKGTGPGKYNDACIRQRILDAGCTNNGSLFKNPSSLNTKDGQPQTISQIYTTLQAIAQQDMIDTESTKQCSGRDIQTPCDPFIMRAGTLKFSTALTGNDTKLKEQANQCLAFLYSNKGASETANPPRVGATYTGMVTYKNNQKEIKNIYCLPEGQLNPATNESAKMTLASKADTGYNGKIGVEAIKAYLNDQLMLAVDMTRNGNTDPDRKQAILNCFGSNLSALPTQATGTPTVVTNPCGVIAQYVRVLPSTANRSDNYIEISQLVVIDKNGNNVASGKSTQGSTGAYPTGTLGSHDASKAIDGQIYAKARNFYISATPGGTAQFLLNLGTPTDITKIIYITRGDTTNLLYRKNGIRLQLLDANQNVLNEKILNSSQREDISYLLSGADSSCKSSLPTPITIAFPAGYTAGLFVRFYGITDPNPDLVPGNRGWGGQIGTPNAYSVINFNDWNIPKPDMCGVVAKGYYVAPGPETLYLYTASDDGIYVTFDGVQRISRWNIHGSTGDFSAPITITQAGVYPFELRFYEWGGGAQCQLLYRINDEATWRSDLSTRFAYKPSEV